MKIVIVGLGIIGGGFAKGLQQRSNHRFQEEVYGIDINSKILKEAEKLGIIQLGFESGERILPKADVIILTLYPTQIKSFIEENRHLFKEDALILEATGVKQHLIQEVNEVIPPNVTMIYTHPMAGGEQKGLRHSNPNVFYGANFLIIDQPIQKEYHLKWVERFAKRLGFGHIEYVRAKEHDEMIAYTSQLPHAMAVALMNATDNPERVAEFTGDSFKELTRISNINAELWSELFLMNREDLLNQISRFQKELTLLKKDLEEKNGENLQQHFYHSSCKHQAFLAKFQEHK